MALGVGDAEGFIDLPKYGPRWDRLSGAEKNSEKASSCLGSGKED